MPRPDDETDEPSCVELEVRLLLEAIVARYGYDLRGYHPASMARRARAAMVKTEAASLGELQHRLLWDPAVFSVVLETLTVQVTEVFRDPAAYRHFRQEVLPVLRTYPQIRIWHAGCASGEEAFATAILLHEAGLLQRTQIYATDLSPLAIERGRQGVYPLDRLQKFAANYTEMGGTRPLDEYCTVGYEHFVFKETLRRPIVFFQHDLVTDHTFGEMHVVFCRNVLIYFGPELRARVIHKLSQSLVRGGFLCLGGSERIGDGEEEKLRFRVFSPEARIYRRADRLPVQQGDDAR